MDLTGQYVFSGPTCGTESLTQCGCQGSSNSGWSYTVSGGTVTIDARGVTGSISGSTGAYTITFSNGYVFTTQVSTPAPPTATRTINLDDADTFLGCPCECGVCAHDSGT